MTNEEFNTEFDLLYSNNANVGPGLDVYDKSVFLTVAQEQMVNNYYSKKSNPKQEGFEETEKRRRDLDELATKAVAINPTQNSLSLSNYSYLFELEENVKFIIQERLKVISPSSCLNNKFLYVEPISHDEYNIQRDNPFKNPDEENVWRLDLSNGIVEIIGTQGYTPFEYHYRYIKRPSPIVLEDLDPGLSIDGISVKTECELQPIAREILDRAVELALEASSNPRLRSKLQLDLRNE